MKQVRQFTKDADIPRSANINSDKFTSAIVRFPYKLRSHLLLFMVSLRKSKRPRDFRARVLDFICLCTTYAVSPFRRIGSR